MRILGVRFRNLNSLTGEWKIDFTHPDYSSNGIFAITGPTGSGKTTVLDAICLGLYGMTPRLSRVTQGSNEIMSRQAGECFAEVTFETQKGRYRCHWSQHRARKRPDGELQPARREVTDAESGRVLESKINQVEAFMVEATGMDFERFTRSMLLAQGGFAAFLQASPDKRAPILEQITGTEIYSRISEKVHVRYREACDKLELLQSELKGIQVLTEDEETTLQDSLKEKQSLENKLSGKINELRKALTWRDAISGLERELAELNKKQLAFENRWEAFKPETTKLEKARKALSLEGDYTGIVALRRQQDADVNELNGATALVPEKEKACEEIQAARQHAENGLNEAKTRQISEADVIKKVREFDTRLGEKKSQLDEKDKAIGNIEIQRRKYQDDLEKTSQALKQSQSELEAVNDYQTKHAADAALPENLPAIGKTFASVRDIEIKHAKAGRDLEIAAGARESAVSACKKSETDHEILRKEFEKKQSELQRMADEMSDILKGREISEWRNETDALKEQERLLIQTGDMIERIAKTNVSVANLGKNLETIKADHSKLLDDIKSVSDQKSRLEKDIEKLETQATLLSRIRDLEEDRKRLEDGIPCPLCGATDHPYAGGNVPELNLTEAALKKDKTEYKKVSAKLGKLEASQAETAAGIRHTAKEMTEKKTTLEADEKQCTEALRLLNIKATDEDRAAKVSEALADVRAKITETAGIVAAAEEKGKQEKTAVTALEKARSKFDVADKTLRDARYKLETAGLERERLIKECAAQAEALETALAAALKDIEPFGIATISLTGLDDILKNITVRKDTWQEKQAEKIDWEKKISDLKSGIDRDTALLSSLDKDLVARHQERDELWKEYEMLGASRRELFGDKNPDQEEKRLADAVGQATKAFEEAREAYVQIEKEISALKEKMALLQGNTKRRATELDQSEQRLKERIQKAGFEDEAEFRLACLDEKERETLAGHKEALISEKTTLEARRKDRVETLAIEWEKNLTEQTAEVLKEEIAVCEANLKQIGQDIGGMVQSLSENKKQKEKQQERIKKVETQKKECVRWNNLHELIGSADGKKYRNFAQGLTFEMMTRYANRQLRKMTDRYLLVRDASQPLELNVIDNYQAGEIRSTKNLSGGESFIVSLALALGLSHMTSQKVRVDSLFLDEGFGTLDEDALETALETLAGLQQDGKLIGVISHVSALKERIATQIQVIPETGGRSSLNGPGCRRI
jgi:exonuclease SbcC